MPFLHPEGNAQAAAVAWGKWFNTAQGQQFDSAAVSSGSDVFSSNGSWRVARPWSFPGGSACPHRPPTCHAAPSGQDP